MNRARHEADNPVPVEANGATEERLENREEPVSTDSDESQVETTRNIEVQFAGRTAVGQIREHNEDNFVCADLSEGKLFPRSEPCSASVGERGLFFAVCDGMGGAAAGEVASQMAVDILFDSLRADAPPSNRDVLARRLVGAVEKAGRKIFDTAQADTTRRGMGTTVTATVLVDKVLFAAQVGDSRAYLLRRGELKQVTKDQSLVSQLIEAGHLTEKEAETFEHSNIILQALGTSESVQVDLSFVELRKGDRLMVCSDGLSGMVDNDVIKESLTSIEEPDVCCEHLIEQANAAGGHDNITVIVVDFTGEGLNEAKATDTVGYIEYPLLPSSMDGSDDSGMDSEEVTVATLRPGRKGAGDSEDDGRTVLKRRSSHLWLVVGVVALAAAAASMKFLTPEKESETGQITDSHEVKPATDQQPSSQEAEEPSSEQETGKTAEVVNVRIHSDIEDALLHINGELKGPLSTREDRIIGMKPGAYRFEARSSGNVVAVVVATVRPDTPLDVSLTMPSGTADPFLERKAKRRRRDALDGVLRPRQRPRRERRLSVDRSPDLRGERGQPKTEKTVAKTEQPTETQVPEADRRPAVSSAPDEPKKESTAPKPGSSVAEDRPPPPKNGSTTKTTPEKSSESPGRIPDNPFE